MSSENINVHSINMDDNGMNMAVSGEAAKYFMITLIKFFENNDGENFLTLTVQKKDKKHELTMRDARGRDTPVERLQRLEEEVEWLRKHCEGDYK